MLQLDHLVLRQGDFALSAHFTVPAGAKVAIVGPSGAGKSTLLMTLAGFFPPQSGRVLWDGHDLAGVDPGDRPLSILFQDQNLFPHLTLAQNLGLGLSPNLRLTPAQRQSIDQTLGRVGLDGMANRRPAELSGGQQGRAALARALLRARPLLLLDEPFAALGPALKSDMLALVTEVAVSTAATVLMVTHDPNDARRFAEMTILVADGVAHPPVPTAGLFANPPAALRAYLGDQ